ncbi:MAG: transcription antitermination factor NusB [Solirubrobacterales bacterium]
MSEVTPERDTAFAVLRRTFENDEYTEIAFRDEAVSRGIDGRVRAKAQMLAYGSVQRRGSSDAIVGGYSKKPGQRPVPEAMAALRLGLFELLFTRDAADHAIVDQAVSLTRAAGAGHAAGFVNAMLRRALREKDSLLLRLKDDSNPKAAAFAHSAPLWLANMWWEELGPDRARTLLASANEPAERAFRINPDRTDREKMIERLAAGDLELEPAEGEWPMAASELIVARGNLAAAEQAAAEGLLVMQSRGSAAVVEVLDPKPDERVLDLCSGPGIKTGQIASRVGRQGNMVAVEVDAERAEQVALQVQRLGYHHVMVAETDGRRGEILSSFDRALVDPPCSDLGALASRPDARWRKSPAVIERLLPLQADLLDRAADSIRSGGVLVYSTCTISRRENAEQVASLVKRKGLTVDDLGALAPELSDATDPRCLQLLPDRDRTTGFFISRLLKP